MKKIASWKKAVFTLGVAAVMAFSAVAYGYVNAERIGINHWFLDEIGLWFGTLPDAKMHYNTDQTPNTLTIGVSTDSNQVVIMELADLDTDAANADPGYPALTIMAADLSNYIQLGNDGTDGFITIGSGSLTIPAIAMAGDLEMATYDINMGSATVDAGSITMIDGAQTGDDEVVFAMSGDGLGDFSVTTDDGHITLAANDDVYLTPTGNDVIVTGRTEITSGAGEALRLLTNATDYTGFTMDANGGMAIESVDDAAAAANISVTADGTYAVTSTGYNLSGAGAVSGVTTLAMGGALSGVTTLEATGRLHTLVGAAEALRLSANTDDYVGFTMDANGALAIATVDTAAAAANIAITADGTYAVTSTGYNLSGAGAMSGVTTIDNAGLISNTVGAAEGLRILTNATDYTNFTMDADGGMTIQSVDAAAAAANIAVVADGTYAVTSTGYNLTGAGGVSGVTTLAMGGELSGVTTIEATGRVHALVGAAEALRLSTNADDYTGFTMDANGGLAITSIDAGAAAANIAITADGTYAVTSTGYNLTGAGAITGVTDLSMTGTAAVDSGVTSILNAGTAGTGVTAVEYGDGKNHVTVLTLTDVNLGTPNAGNNSAHGSLIYTFPAGVHLHSHSWFSVGLTVGTVTTDAPDVGVGSVIGSGAIAVLNGGTMEDYVTGITWATALDGTAEIQNTIAATAGLFTGISNNASGDTKAVHFNVADGWNVGVTGDLMASGTVTILWQDID